MDLRFMRHRRRDDLSSFQGYLDVSDGSRREITTDSFTIWEEIYDLPGGRSREFKFRDPNPVLHVKVEAQPGYYFPWTDWNTCTPVRWRQSLYPQAVVDSFLSVPHSLLNNASMSAFESLYSQVPKTISIPNFLYELKDFKEIAENLSKIPAKAKYQARFRGIKAPKGTKPKRRSPRSYLKGANNAYLSYSFNWAPFISDLEKLSKIGDNVTKRLDWLRRTRGKIVPVHYAQSLNGDWQKNGESWLVHQNDHYMSYYGENVRWVRDFHDVKFHASGLMFHELEGLNDAWTNWKAFLAGSGFNNPLSIVWNAIPYSFLIDWLFPIGKWLDTYASINPFPGKWDVYNVCHSINERGQISFYQEFYPDYGNPTRYMGCAKFERYTRDLKLPPLDFNVGLNLSTQQQSLLASLFAGKYIP